MNTPAYAVAYLRNIRFGDAIIEYLQRIDATLAEFGGRFIVHGGQPSSVEGEWDGNVVIIEFPSRLAAVKWYQSPGYQAILPLRTENTDSVVTVVDGVPTGYQATDRLAMLLGTSR